ncbi:MAG: hypothetical protein LBH35_01975, partial [Treponema sp.]|nr:hypothetical protein [Treponema sp.]
NSLTTNHTDQYGQKKDGGQQVRVRLSRSRNKSNFQFFLLHVMLTFMGDTVTVEQTVEIPEPGRVKRFCL